MKKKNNMKGYGEKHDFLYTGTRDSNLLGLEQASLQI